MKINIQKLVRVIAPILVIALIISLASPALASSNQAYIDVTPDNSVGIAPSSGAVLYLKFPSWYTGYPSNHVVTYYLIGYFRNCHPIITATAGNALISSSGDMRIYRLTTMYEKPIIVIQPDDSTVTGQFEVQGVFMKAPGWEGSLTSVDYVGTEATGFVTDGYSTVSLPYTTSITDMQREHWVKVPSSALALSDCVTLDFYIPPNTDVFHSYSVVAFSGSHLIPITYTNRDAYWSVTVEDYDPAYDLYFWIRINQPYFITLESCTVRYGLLLDETGLLSLINESLNSNFQSLEDLLESQHSAVIEILDSNNSWLGRIHTAITNGFTSVGSWFTTLWNNLSSSFANVGTWIQNQTDTLGAKLDALINGTQAQQEAAQQAQQNAANLQGNVDNASGQLSQVGNALDSVAKPEVNMSLDGFGVDYSSLITLTAPLTQDRTIGAIMGIMAVLMLLSFVVFGKKG